MSIYRVSSVLTVGCFKEIEAKSQLEAIEKARKLASPELCSSCSSAGEGDDTLWEIEAPLDDPDDSLEVELVEEV